MSRIEISEGETRRYVWQFEDEAGAVDFTDAAVKFCINLGNSWRALALEDLGDGYLAAIIPADIPARAHGYPWQLWVTWSNGEDQKIDQGALVVMKGATCR